MTEGGGENAIDRDHLDRQTGGDRELAAEVLGLFAEQCDRHVAAIRGEGALPARLDAAHTLKGAAGAVGAHRVAAAAAAAERDLAAGETAQLAASLAELAASAEEAQAEIARRPERA